MITREHIGAAIIFMLWIITIWSVWKGNNRKNKRELPKN